MRPRPFALAGGEEHDLGFAGPGGSSPAIVPSRMTRMRSLMPMTSGSSEEDHQDGGAGARQLAHQLVDPRLGADVDAARRLVEDQDLRAASPATWRARPSAGCRRSGSAPPAPGSPRAARRGGPDRGPMAPRSRSSAAHAPRERSASRALSRTDWGRTSLPACDPRSRSRSRPGSPAAGSGCGPVFH